MDRHSSLRRRTYVFAGAAVLFLAITLVRGATEKEVASGKALPATFVGIDPDKVQVVEIERTVQRDGKPAKEAVRLERSGVASWVLASSEGYAADPKKVEDFVKRLSDVRTRAENTTSEGKFASFAGPDGFTDVRLLGQNGDPIVSFGVGKGNAEGSYGNTYLRIDELPTKGRPAGTGARFVARIVAVTGIDLWGKTEVTSWIETRIWPGLVESDVASVEWKYPPKPIDARLVRGTKGEKDTEEPWTLERPAPGGPAKTDAATQVVQALVGLQIAGVEGRTGPGADEKYGFDKPDLVVVGAGKAGKDVRVAPSWQIEVGKKIEGKSTWYARRSLTTGPDAWIYAVNDHELTRFRDDPSELLEKKPEPPPATPDPAAMTDGPPTPPTEPAAMSETPPAPPTPAPPTPAPDVPDAPPAMDEPPPAPPSPPAMSDESPK